ncbi:MAG TPA: Rieske 2Fe-2S domain-containing protein [Solirubrobacterales bacterium]|nr:Rieske 2Fe-2S domain-containing protein [Solirubrobacterales bacterium]
MSQATATRARASLPAAELGPGEMTGLVVGEVAVVVVRTTEGELRAYRDRCVHQGAPLSRGRLRAGTEGEEVGEYRLVEGQGVIKCPWHGYEYDAASGCALFDSRRRLRRVTVEELDGEIVVSV